MSDAPAPESLGMDRQVFLDRIRAALGPEANRVPAGPPEFDESLVRLAGASDDCIKLFQRCAEEVGMAIHRTTSACLDEKIQSLLTECSCQRAVITTGDESLTAALTQVVNQSGGEVVAWRESPGMDAHFDADVGITDVEAALAETGTLIISTDRDHPRGAYLAPPIHIAIVPVSRILPDMLDFLVLGSGRTGAELPSATVFITGPSKTADIEGVLVTGVHGPREVHVVVVDDS